MVKDKREESSIDKYNRVRRTLIQISEDYGLELDEFIALYPEDVTEIFEKKGLRNMTAEMNSIIASVIKEFCLRDWMESIEGNFDDAQRKDVFQLVQTTISCDASIAYLQFSKVDALLRKLSNKNERKEALKYFQQYCKTHSFEDLINDYYLVFKSIHAKDLEEARDAGWLESGVSEQKLNKYMHYFNASARTDSEHKENACGK